MNNNCDENNIENLNVVSADDSKSINDSKKSVDSFENEKCKKKYLRVIFILLLVILLILAISFNIIVSLLLKDDKCDNNCSTTTKITTKLTSTTMHIIDDEVDDSSEIEIFELRNGIKVVSFYESDDEGEFLSLKIDDKVIHKFDDGWYSSENMYSINDGDFVVELAELHEGFYDEYYLFYGDKHEIFDFSKYTSFSHIKKLSFENNIFTITSEKFSYYLDMACLEDSEDTLYRVTEKIQYLGDGKLKLISKSDEKTLLDIIKDTGGKSCKNLGTLE